MDRPADQTIKPGRIILLDLVRAAALLGMVFYHFGYDLELFGYRPPGSSISGAWGVFARGIAGTFLFLVGVSLYLAHGQGIRWRAFIRRFLIIAGAALLITIATRIAIPGQFIFFGILHSIAAASLIGLAFLNLPAIVTFAAAIGVFYLASLPPLPALNTPWTWWLGLSVHPPTVDYLPVFPWLAPCLLGIGAAKLAAQTGLWDRLRPIGQGVRGPVFQAILWSGRHTLAIYLLHQPILIALLWLWVQLFG